jgi:hypothetical protein
MSNLKQNVRQLIAKDRSLADSDNKLIYSYWYNIVEEDKTGANFIAWFRNNTKLCTTITRHRRLIEAENPKLRGKTYKVRHHLEKVVREKIKKGTF